MSIIPVSRLSGSDLAQLGNNFVPRPRRGPRPEVKAINRSLAAHGEKIARLYQRPPIYATVRSPAPPDLQSRASRRISVV